MGRRKVFLIVVGVCWTASSATPPQDATDAGPRLAKTRLQIAPSDASNTFRGVGADNADTMLFEAGISKRAFECGAPDGIIATEGSETAVRHLTLSHRAEAGLFDRLSSSLKGGAAQSSKGRLAVTNARLTVKEAGANSATATAPGGSAVLEPSLPAGTELEVEAPSGSTAGHAVPLSVQYDCWSQTTLLIELRLQVLGDGGDSEVCLSWRKACALGFGTLAIEEGDQAIYSDGTLLESWSKSMLDEGTSMPSTQLKLRVNKGTLRLAAPTANSDQKLLRVEVRGPFMFGDGVLEVTQEPALITVLYTCEYEGHGDVVLKLAKSTPTGSTRPADSPQDTIELRWKKLCGITEFRHMQIYLRSELLKNKTQVASHGLAIEKFRRPCVGSEIHALAAGGPEAPQCVGSTTPRLEISEDEGRSLLDASFTSDSLSGSLLDQVPDLSYDRKALQVTISVAKDPTHKTSRSKDKKKLPVTKTFAVKYTCFRAGVHSVMVTVHVLAHRRVDLVWSKRCNEPRPRVGKALTAPQALIITFLICACVGLVALCCCFFPNKSEDQDGIEMAKSGEALDKLGLGAINKASGGERWRKRQENQKLGAAARDGAAKLGQAEKEEVVFHA